MAREPQRPGFAAHGGANAFEPPLGKPLAGKKPPSDARYPVGKGYDPKLDSNSASFRDSTGGSSSGGGRAAPATHGVGGGVVSAKKKSKPDLAVSMKQMLRRK